MIRKMSLGDKSQILSLETQNWKAWDWKFFEKSFDSESNLCCYVFEERKKVLGYILFQFLGEEGEIQNICVLKEYRQKKIASALLSHLLKICRAKGLDGILLEVRSKNKPALKLYQKFNFRVDTKRKNYYTLPDDDAILMSLKL